MGRYRRGWPHSGEIMFAARRYNAAYSWATGSIGNLTFDVIDYDPYGMANGAPPFFQWLARFPGRYLARVDARVNFGSAAGSGRYLRQNIAGSVGMSANLPFTTGQILVPVPAWPQVLGQGSASAIEVFQDTGAAQSVAEAYLSVAYMGPG